MRCHHGLTDLIEFTQPIHSQPKIDRSSPELSPEFVTIDRLSHGIKSPLEQSTIPQGLGKLTLIHSKLENIDIKLKSRLNTIAG
jgi:hypothetical protein